MKKIIITIIILLGVTTGASAFYYDSALVKTWNDRPDLQKAFPGNPEGNSKLEEWAGKYGWKESPELFNYYPEKDVVERIIEAKTNDRIASLERQIAALSNQIDRMQGNQVVNIQPVVEKGKWRPCRIMNESKRVVCEVDDSDWATYDNGNFNILFYTK